MPSGAASGGQKSITPYQSSLNWEAASEHASIEFIEERLRVGCALRLFCKRQRFFRCPWSFRRRGFRLCLEWGFWRSQNAHCDVSRERSRARTTTIDVASDGSLFLRV